ncbi:MAG: hypothetical protein ACI4MF_08015 [Candidatus Faecivicinus sp.]
MELKRRQVTHRKYGSGTVTGFDGRVLTVFFDQYGSHSFRYPDIFAEELKASEPEVQRFVEAALAGD